MRFLETKQEIAKAMNIDKLPVVRIDLADADDYGIKSQMVKIDSGTFGDGSPYYIRATVRVFSDSGDFVFQSNGSFISNSFTYDDMTTMIDYANAPIIKKDSDVLICVIDSKTNSFFKPCILHTGDWVNRHCITPMAFIDKDNLATPYLYCVPDEKLVNGYIEDMKRRREGR